MRSPADTGIDGPIDGFDSVVFSLAALALFAAAFAAFWRPARQATRVSPLVALRTE